MGMTIDEITQGLKETIIICDSVYAYDRKKYIDGAIDRLHKYQQLQADYENRLKADVVAMLTEIQLEIERLEQPTMDEEGFTLCQSECLEIIQQKINALKEDTV